MELRPEMVRAFADTFIHRADIVPFQQPQGHYVSLKKPLTHPLVEGHLRGHITIGAYALDTYSRAHWICLDADTDAVWSQTLNMAANLTSEGLTPYIEPSRRGGHLWLFTPPLSGLAARAFGKQLIADYQLPNEMELYPRQNKLVTGPGSLVRLPLGVHRKSGKRYHFLTLAGIPLAPTIREQIAILSNPKRVPDDYIQETLQRAPQTRLHPPTPPFSALPDIRADTASAWIKSRISAMEYISWHVELDNRGRAHCPFHDDAHQSFGVNAQGNYWSCFAGCGGGSVIDFAMKWRERHGQDGSFTATVRAMRRELD